MTPCWSQATTLPTGFGEDLAAAYDAGWNAVEVWLTKLEDHLERTRLSSLKEELASRGVSLVAGAYQGGLLLPTGAARQAHGDHFRRRLELCEALGIRTLIVVPDAVGSADASSLSRAVEALAEAALWAEGFGVHLALEFQAQHPFCASLPTALAIVQAAGRENLGVCLDAFHFHKGPSKTEDLASLTRPHLAHVQLCDVAGLPREIMTDSDRVFPGEGDFNLAPLLERLRTIGYDGYVSLELFNPQLWQGRPAQVAELGRQALEALLKR